MLLQEITQRSECDSEVTMMRGSSGLSQESDTRGRLEVLNEEEESPGLHHKYFCFAPAGPCGMVARK